MRMGTELGAEKKLLIDESLARAVVCRTLKLGLRRPDAYSIAQLFSEEGRNALKWAAPLVGQDTESLEDVAAELGRFKDRALPELERCYDALFGHTARGKVCAYETEYGAGHMFLQAKDLADISGYFHAFGLRLEDSTGERADHIAVEWEFLEFLSDKDVFALRRNDSAMREVTGKAYRSFMRDHISRFGRALARSLIREKPGCFYGVLGRLCESFIILECGRLELPAGPEFVSLRADSLDDAPMACGEAQDLVQVSGIGGETPEL